MNSFLVSSDARIVTARHRDWCPESGEGISLKRTKAGAKKVFRKIIPNRDGATGTPIQWITEGMDGSNLLHRPGLIHKSKPVAGTTGYFH